MFSCDSQFKVPIEFLFCLKMFQTSTLNQCSSTFSITQNGT